MSNDVFLELYNLQVGTTQMSAHDTVSLISKFKKSLSFNWIKSIKGNTQEYLQQVMITILQLTENKNTSVRLAAYSTMGTLVLAVAPYSPSTFISAFGYAITSLNVSPKISIAIINTFMSLMRFVSPVRIQTFVEDMPILHHFSADITDFIQYLPKTMPMMKKLPFEFQKRILHSLVLGCQKEPNNNFSVSISLLIGHNQELLIQYLVKQLIKDDLGIAAIWIGPTLFANRENFNLTSSEGIEFFLSKSLEQLNSTPLNLSYFDCSCQIIAYIARYTNDESKKANIIDRVKEHLLPSYKPIFNISLLTIPNERIELITDNTEEPDSIRSKKLNLLINFFYDHIKTVDSDQISEMLYNLRNSENDLYSSLLDNFSKCVNDMFLMCKKDFHINLLTSLLSRKNLTWVQKMKLVQLIDKINIDFCIRHIPDYQKIIIDILIEFSISPTVVLFEYSVKVLRNIATYDTINIILEGIRNSDWLDENIAYKRFYLLADLSKQFHVEYFSFFVGIAYEYLLFCSNLSTCSQIFKFLSLVKITYVPDEVKKFSFEFIEKHYYKYSHCLIDEKSEFGQSLTENEFDDLLDYDTDIVTNPLINHKNALSHLKHCYAFLCSLPSNLLNDKDKLYRYSISFVTIFDKFALEMAAKLAVGNKKNEEFVWRLSIDTFTTTNDDEVAASCCHIFVNDQFDLPDNVNKMFEQFIGDRCTLNPELLFLCFLNVDQYNHEKVVKSIPTVLSWLSIKNGTILLFKLIQIVGRDVIPLIHDEYGLALLQYANEFGGEYSETVRKYIQITDYSEFPITEPTMNENLILFMEDEKRICIKNPDNLDMDHWKFVFNHVFIFDLSNLSDYINDHQSIFARIDAESLRKIYYRKFSIGKDFITKSNLPKFPSNSPFISQGTFIRNSSLIKSFCKFRQKPISNDVFLSILHYLIEAKDVHSIKEFIRYSLLSKQEGLIVIDDDLYYHPYVIHLTSLINPDLVLKFYKLEKKSSLIVDEEIDDKFRLAIVSKDPDFYIQYLIDYEKFKKKHFLIMIKLLMSVKFSIEKLSDLIVKYLSQFEKFETERKKEIFLRFLTASLFCITRRYHLSEYKSFINFLSFHISTVALSFDGGILNEFSYLFSQIAKSSFEEEFFNNFLKFVLPILSAPPLFITSAFEQIISDDDAITLNTSKNSNNNNNNNDLLLLVNSDSFLAIFDYELPSYTCCILNVLQKIHPTNDFYLSIQIKFDSLKFKYNFKVVHYMYMFASKHDFAIPKFEEIFLNDSADACFGKCVGIALKSSNVVDKIFNADFCSAEIISAISEILKKKSLANFQKASNYFLKFPRIETWQLVEKAARAKPENLLKILFIGIPMKIDRFLVLYCCLRRYYMKNKAENKLKIQEVVQMAADSFSIQSRFFALMMIWSNDPKTVNLGYIVAAVESNNFNVIADEYEKICSSK